MSNPLLPAAAALAASSSPALCPPEAFAEVRARDHVMRYRRSGAGRPVLLLGAGAAAEGEPAPVWPELSAALAAQFRLIVPEIPADATAAGEVAALLVDFLDGLGAAGVSVVAADAFCIAALELALLDTDRVARVALVPGGGGGGATEEAGLDGALATTARAARPVPLLVVRRGLAAAEALPLLTRFLVAEQEPTPGHAPVHPQLQQRAQQSNPATI